MYSKEIDELLDIEKKILKIYNNLISNKLSNNEKQYKKEFEYLNIVLEYEEEKMNKLLQGVDTKKIEDFLNSINPNLAPFNSQVLSEPDLYKYRLLKTLVRRYDDSILNDDISEMYIKYIWCVNDFKDKNNNEKITTIQYYMCFLDQSIERFFLDNYFDFDKKYLNIRFSTMSKKNIVYSLHRFDILSKQMTYGLIKINQIMRYDYNSDESLRNEYIYYKAFLKGIIYTLGRAGTRNYIENLERTSKEKADLLNMVLGDEIGQLEIRKGFK